MKKNRLSDYIKWFSSNYIGLIMLPITVFFLIISIYGSTFDHEIRSNKSRIAFFQISSYLNFFVSQKKLCDSIVEPEIVDISFDVQKYNHLLVIDRTLSTNEKNDSALKFASLLLKSSINSNDTKFDLNKIDDFLKIKNSFIMKFYRHFINNGSTLEFCPTFYDGYKDSLSFIYLKDQQCTIKWVPVDNIENKKIFISRLNEEKLTRLF